MCLTTHEMRRGAWGTGAWIEYTLARAGEMDLGELEKLALGEGYARETYNRAKRILVREEKAARSWSTGFGEKKKWWIELLPRQEERSDGVRERMA